MPTQIGKLFDAPWRLPNGIMNASKNQLEGVVSACERSEKWSAAAVVAGLFIEVALAVFHVRADSFSGIFGTVLADELIFLGVLGETLFGNRGKRAQSELQRRSDLALAEAVRAASEANERAAKADLARVELEAKLADRHLTETQFNELQSLRDKVKAVAMTAASDAPSAMFAGEIALALRHAGIEVTIYAPRIGLVWFNLYIVFPQAPAAWQSEPLYAAFHKAGLSVGCGTRALTPMTDLPPDVPVIMVGEKGGLRPDTPPFMAGLASPAPEKLNTTE